MANYYAYKSISIVYTYIWLPQAPQSSFSLQSQLLKRPCLLFLKLAKAKGHLLLAKDLEMNHKNYLVILTQVHTITKHVAYTVCMCTILNYGGTTSFNYYGPLMTIKSSLLLKLLGPQLGLSCGMPPNHKTQDMTIGSSQLAHQKQNEIWGFDRLKQMVVFLSQQLVQVSRRRNFFVSLFFPDVLISKGTMSSEQV